jgi:hypothetical protein
VSDQASYPYKTTGKIIFILYFLIEHRKVKILHRMP